MLLLLLPPLLLRLLPRPLLLRRRLHRLPLPHHPPLLRLHPLVSLPLPPSNKHALLSFLSHRDPHHNSFFSELAKFSKTSHSVKVQSKMQFLSGDTVFRQPFLKAVWFGMDHASCQLNP